MSKQIRPVIIPTALSSGTMLWTAVLILYFLAASAAYTAWCRLSAAEKRLNRHFSTVTSREPASVSGPFTVTSAFEKTTPISRRA